MAIQPRSGRAPRTSGGPVAKPPNTAPHASSHRPNTPYTLTDGFDEDGRPAKKRKLSIRNRQTTLDRFTVIQQGPLKPPTSVRVEKPDGQLVETINGVRIKLDATEADLTNAAPTATAAGQPSTAATNTTEKKKDKRTLRSQDDGPRLKSELATYFPNYEDVIFDAPKEPEFITVDTALYVTDEAPKEVKSQQSSPAKNSKAARAAAARARNGSLNGLTSPTTPLRNNMNQFNSPSESLEMIARTLPANPEDPLTDAHFFISHRRAERKEKQLRNIERERAMHEKVQLDRLLDGLKGHDWLKVLGITGITDGEAKKYEPKRDYFIAEVEALVDKFRQWKEQEKQQKLEKDAAAAAAKEAGSEGQESEDGSVEPPSSDLNASAARQLQQETVNAVKSIPKLKLSFANRQPTATATPPPQPVVFQQPSPEVPMTSFYKKRHLREAALGKARHGRNATAFGHPIPNVDEREFTLPEDYATEDTLRSNARERRRRNRASMADASLV